jgi:hypothetical protein
MKSVTHRQRARAKWMNHCVPTKGCDNITRDTALLQGFCRLACGISTPDIRSIQGPVASRDHAYPSFGEPDMKRPGCMRSRKGTTDYIFPFIILGCICPVKPRCVGQKPGGAPVFRHCGVQHRGRTFSRGRNNHLRRSCRTGQCIHANGARYNPKEKPKRKRRRL